jgi:UDP-glucuronate decarboxylase
MGTPEGFTGPVNLGNPVEFTIIELAEMVLEMTGSKCELVRKPLPQDDPVMRKPDITLANEKLGWQPTIPLREGLRKTIDYFDDLLKSDDTLLNTGKA